MLYSLINSFTARARSKSHTLKHEVEIIKLVTFSAEAIYVVLTSSVEIILYPADCLSPSWYQANPLSVGHLRIYWCTELLAALCVTSHILIIMNIKVGPNYLLSEHQLNYSYLTPGWRYRDCLLVQWFHRELHSPSLGSEQMGLHESGWMKLATARRKSKPLTAFSHLSTKAQVLK